MSVAYTLVIPTFNRPQHLRTLLGYLESVGFLYPVLVLDSSADAAALADNERTVSAYPSSITRRVFPGETFFYDKVREGLRSLDSELFSFCADDDFVIPRSVATLVAALEAEPALVFAQGVFGRVLGQSGGASINLEYRAKNYRQPTPLARLQEFLIEIESTFYSVFRREPFLRGLDAARPIRSMLFNELFASLAPLIQGCGVGLPVLYYLRGSGAAAQRYSRWHPVMWICESYQDFLAQFIEYRDRLADFIRSCPGAAPAGPPETLIEALDKVHIYYFSESVITSKSYFLSHLSAQQRKTAAPIKGSFGTFPVAKPFWRRWFRSVARTGEVLELRTQRGQPLAYHQKLVTRVGVPEIAATHPVIAQYIDRKFTAADGAV